MKNSTNGKPNGRPSGERTNPAIAEALRIFDEASENGSDPERGLAAVVGWAMDRLGANIYASRE